jgi:hypothetical protein
MTDPLIVMGKRYAWRGRDAVTIVTGGKIGRRQLVGRDNSLKNQRVKLAAFCHWVLDSHAARAAATLISPRPCFVGILP